MNVVRDGKTCGVCSSCDRVSLMFVKKEMARRISARYLLSSPRVFEERTVSTFWVPLRWRLYFSPKLFLLQGVITWHCHFVIRCSTLRKVWRDGATAFWRIINWRHSPEGGEEYMSYKMCIWKPQRNKSEAMRDFRLPPRCRWDLRSSGTLRSVQW